MPGKKRKVDQSQQLSPGLLQHWARYLQVFQRIPAFAPLLAELDDAPDAPLKIRGLRQQAELE
jgi:hypothetical protein